MKSNFLCFVTFVCFVGQLMAQSPRSISGIYPSLAMFNNEGECGTGAVVPWADRLWVITYGPHLPFGSSDKLYEITPQMKQIVRPESVGGTPANRMIHNESQQLFIGPYVIDAERKVRVIPPSIMPGRLTGNARDKLRGKTPDIHRAKLSTRSKGRQVEVKVAVCDWLGWLDVATQWPGLRSVTRLQRWRVDEHGNKHHTIMYLLSSFTGAKAILRGATGRWAIENSLHSLHSLHWVLDVTYDEDGCRTRDRNAAHNLALLRRMAGNLLQLDGSKMSMKAKRLLCASSRTFLFNALHALNVHA